MFTMGENSCIYTVRQSLKYGGNHRCERSFSMDSEGFLKILLRQSHLKYVTQNFY